MADDKKQSGTLYDSTRREGEHKESGFWDIKSGHVVNTYDDNYRHSHDNNDTKDHWTNQDLPLGDPGRRDPPDDATKKK